MEEFDLLGPVAVAPPPVPASLSQPAQPTGWLRVEYSVPQRLRDAQTVYRGDPRRLFEAAHMVARARRAEAVEITDRPLPRGEYREYFIGAIYVLTGKA